MKPCLNEEGMSLYYTCLNKNMYDMGFFPVPSDLVYAYFSVYILTAYLKSLKKSLHLIFKIF